MYRNYVTLAMYRNYVTLAMYNFGTPWGWYKCIETCRSDYNTNIVKINIYCELLVEIKTINILCYYGIIINYVYFASPRSLSVWFVCNIWIIWQLIMKNYMTYLQPKSTTVLWFLISCHPKYALMNHNANHHHELWMGRPSACSLTLKVKLVPPSFRRASDMFPSSRFTLQ